MESENSLDDIIEYDPESSDEKENVNSDPIKQPRTTNEQFSKIVAFVNEYNEKKLDKVTYDLLWFNLAAELNDIGPPNHTKSEWRRIWSSHKRYKKRKLLVESDFEEDDASCSGSPTVEKGPHKSEKLNIIIDNQSKLSVKMDTIIGNQSEMIVNQQLMIYELQSSNKLLKDIAMKP